MPCSKLLMELKGLWKWQVEVGEPLNQIPPTDWLKRIPIVLIQEKSSRGMGGGASVVLIAYLPKVCKTV